MMMRRARELLSLSTGIIDFRFVLVIHLRFIMQNMSHWYIINDVTDMSRLFLEKQINFKL